MNVVIPLENLSKFYTMLPSVGARRSSKNQTKWSLFRENVFALLLKYC